MRGLLSGLLLVLFPACTGRSTPPVSELEAVGPPDLTQLDRAVREQFESLWSALPEPGQATDPTVGASWGALGQWFDVYGYPDSATRSYRNARQLDPDEPRWPYYLGARAEEAGDLDEAAELYTLAAQLAPRAIEPRVRLGELALRRQDLDAAERIFTELAESSPDSPGVLLGIGRLALLRGDAAAAIEPLQRLLDEQPEAGEVHYSLSLAWRQLGEENRAADHLARIPEDNLDQIALQVDEPWMRELEALDRGARVFTRRGVRAFKRGEHERAVVLFGQAVTADPGGPEKRINYAIALRETGRVAPAREQLEQALHLAEADSEMAARAHLELGRISLSSGRPSQALLHFEATLRIDPRSIPGHVEAARLFQRLGRLEEALEHYATLRSLDRPLPETRFWHAATLSLLERYGEAVQALEEDLEELGNEPRLRLLLARLLSAAPQPDLREPDRAQELVTLREAATDVLYAETVAMVAAEQGRFRDAVTWQRAAVDALAEVRPRSAVQTARRRLELYEREQPCRNPWEATEIPIYKTVSGT